MSYTENILEMLSDRIDCDRQDMIITPTSIAKEMIELLPEEVWNKNTTFLDPACKSGIFLHEIYLKLMDTESLIKEFPDKSERRQHILHNQLFGIALDHVCQLTTARTVYGTIKGNNNIKLIDGYINVVKNKDTRFYTDKIKEQFGDMKFDVVIGNPPYQDSNGGGARGIGGSTLYHKFIDKALEMASVVCMITKNNWFQSDVLEKTRANMVDAGITDIINYPVIGEVFNGVDVSVCIFCINKDSDGITHYKKIENNKTTSEYRESIKSIGYIPDSTLEIGIVRKTKNNMTFSNIALSNTPFGIRTNGKKSSGIFVDENQLEIEEYKIGLLYMDGSSTYFNFITENDIERNFNIVGRYKIICGQQLNKNKSVLTNIRGLAPNQVCTSSFGVVYHSESKDEAYKAHQYIKTHLFRFLVYCSIDTVSTISPSRFKLVPIQDFSSASDIDWTQSIPDIDKQLYRKYSLTQEEIDYIEATIKPM